MSLKQGSCCLCNENLIDWANNKLKDNAFSHYLEISKKQMLVVLICTKCRSLLTAGNKVKKTADKILEMHKSFWKNNPKNAPSNFEDFKVTDANCSDKKHRMNMLKYKEEETIKNIKK